MLSKDVLEMAIRDCESIAKEWDDVAKRKMQEYDRYSCVLDNLLQDSQTADSCAAVARACAARISERLKLTAQYDEKSD